MKKWLSVLLAASITAASVTNVFADEIFTDISDEKYSWAYPYIVSMVDEGYITGYEDNTFRPDNSVTRLEVLALFSRALGAKEKVNQPLLEMAVEEYGDIIEEYDLNWGVEEIAFLMYRGVLKETDLVTYLDGTLKDEPMPRYEAAVIITKAMGGESTVNAETNPVVDFNDADEIPENALGYVSYVNSKGIMTGMDGGNFSPKTDVLRSQMAVMLSRTCDATKYSFELVKIVGIDVGGRLVSYKAKDGQTYDVGYSKTAVMSVLGEPVTPKEMPVGVNAIITKAGKTISYIDTLASIPDAEVSGKFVARATTDGITSVTIKNSENNENETYPCAENVSVTYNKTPSSLTNFVTNDYITIKMVNGEITTIVGESKEGEINGAIIEDISLSPDFTITISHALEEHDGKVLQVASDATVRKNGQEADFSQVYPGDRVNLTTKYGVVQTVVANTSSTSAEGTIDTINISSRPYITVNVRGEVQKYYVTNDVEIKINNEDATLYDFRVGDAIKVVLEGQAVKKITATSAQSSNGEVKGVVTAVNQSYGFIRVSYNTSGYTAEETVYCKDATTKVMTSMGVTKKISDIKEGQTVTATGTTSNGAFSAKLIVISEAE